MRTAPTGVFTYDDNGNCVEEEYYSGNYLASTVIIPQLTSPPSEGGTKGYSHHSVLPLRHSQLDWESRVSGFTKIALVR